MLVHFPVTTLLLATIAGLCAIFVKAGNFNSFLSNVTLLLLLIGVITGWAAIYTGLLSYTIEVRKLCDPEVLQEHERWGYIAVIIYSIGLACQLLARWLKKAPLILLSVITLMSLVGGCLALTYCGHLGASVVYQQGAGTYKPSANCKEFEK